jgi:hypothetical protein
MACSGKLIVLGVTNYFNRNTLKLPVKEKMEAARA